MCYFYSLYKLNIKNIYLREKYYSLIYKINYRKSGSYKYLKMYLYFSVF